MRQFRHGVLGAAMILTTCAGGSGLSAAHASRATATNAMVVHMKVTGDLHYTEMLTHSEDIKDTIPGKYSCVRFTHPNFAPKGKPLAYALSFNNPNVMAATSGAFVSFYYDPKKLGSQHVEGDNVFLAVPAKNVSFGPGGEGTYTVVVHMASDLHSGTVTATNMRNMFGAGHVTVQITWSCPIVFARAT